MVVHIGCGKAEEEAGATKGRNATHSPFEKRTDCNCNYEIQYKHPKSAETKMGKSYERLEQPSARLHMSCMIGSFNFYKRVAHLSRFFAFEFSQHSGEYLKM